jgi:tRNA-2-methylthio-N6-dimethylallyladenosine synthase
MTGCNNFCSYCVVPYARGKEISRPATEIIKEIEGLIKNGYKEIILLGQNVNSYHGTWSIKHKTKIINFSELLKKINAIPGYFWISFISNHPKDFSNELIETATKLTQVCEFIHLPLQAGDNQILARMNRKYTRQEYLKLIAKIKRSFRKYKPGKLYSITSDIIVGFPGEARKQFLQSAEVMQKVGFDMVYFGQYSPRPGTYAWKMKDNIKKAEKAWREKYLNEILKKTSLANNKKYLGKVLEVLIDKKTDRNYFGRTRTTKNVKIISTKKNLIGKIIKVKIIKANAWNLGGICHPADDRP